MKSAIKYAIADGIDGIDASNVHILCFNTATVCAAASTRRTRQRRLNEAYVVDYEITKIAGTEEISTISNAMKDKVETGALLTSISSNLGTSEFAADALAATVTTQGVTSPTRAPTAADAGTLDDPVAAGATDAPTEKPKDEEEGDTFRTMTIFLALSVAVLVGGMYMCARARKSAAVRQEEMHAEIAKQLRASSRRCEDLERQLRASQVRAGASPAHMAAISELEEDLESASGPATTGSGRKKRGKKKKKKGKSKRGLVHQPRKHGRGKSRVTGRDSRGPGHGEGPSLVRRRFQEAVRSTIVDNRNRRDTAASPRHMPRVTSQPSMANLVRRLPRLVSSQSIRGRRGSTLVNQLMHDEEQAFQALHQAEEADRARELEKLKKRKHHRRSKKHGRAGPVRRSSLTVRKPSSASVSLAAQRRRGVSFSDARAHNTRSGLHPGAAEMV